MSDYQLIDYDRSQEDRTCNAVLIAEHGKAEAMWAVDVRGELVHGERVIANGVFADLWDGIMASIGARGVFWASLITDPSRLVDPTTHHVITVVQVLNGQMQHRTFMVPLHEADPEFTAWLSLLNSTRQPLAALPADADETKRLVSA